MSPHHAHPRRPSIGVTPDVTTATPEAPLPKFEVRVAYAEAVHRAGGLAFVLPYAEDHASIEAYLDRISGLVISGGAFDVPPELYGEAPREGLGPTKPARTTFELALVRGALSRHLPVLGICGGMQLLNVAFGGSLVQDVGRELPKARSHQQQHDRTQPHHPVDVAESSLLADALGKGQLMVNSTHHQAVSRLGKGLIASAVAPDGVVEAVESSAQGFVLGVQWHPELMIDTVPPHLGVYKALVARARERRH